MTALCKTYYVNPQTGRDTNDGLTPEKRWPHCLPSTGWPWPPVTLCC